MWKTLLSFVFCWDFKQNWPARKESKLTGSYLLGLPNLVFAGHFVVVVVVLRINILGRVREFCLRDRL